MTPANALAACKAHLLADPSRIDARAAALRVISERYRCSLQNAADHLDELRSDVLVNALFARVLPGQHKKTKGTRSERARRFADALGFPINDDYLFEEAYEIACNGGNLYHTNIPVHSMQPVYWEGAPQLDELPIAFQLATVMERISGTHHVTPQQDDEEWRTLSSLYDLPAVLRPTGQVRGEDFVSVFASQRNPLKHLPTAMRMKEYNTGCFWFDFSYEWMENDLMWTTETIEWLREEYKAAKVIERGVDGLNQWLLVNPTERLSKALRLYRRARKLSDDSKTSARVRVHAGTPLVAIL